MWCGDCQMKSRFSSRFLTSSFFVVLMMLPMSAHGELELNAAVGPFIGGVNIDVSGKGEGEGNFRPGFDLGLVYWFGLLGVGMEYLSSTMDCGNTTLDFRDLHFCLLVRIQFDQNPAFPHGRIVPYLGIGAFPPPSLKGDFKVRSSVSGGYFTGLLDSYSFELVLKAGLEWMILGWLGIFVEGRIMTGTLEMEFYTYGSETKAKADIPGQVIIGVALHIFK
jgi:hypothetical protein